MGKYLNPATGTKEQWLEKNAKKAETPPEAFEKDGHTAACLVDNGMFTACGLAYSQSELAAFKEPDRRKKIWWWVPNELTSQFQ